MTSKRKAPKLGADKELERLRAENRSLKRFGVYSSISKIGCELIRTLRTVGPFYFVYLSIRDFPAHDLRADLKGTVRVESDSLVDALATFLNDSTLVLIALAFGICSIVYGKLQAKLRRDDVERLSRYKEEYEKLMDPKRSSSRLTTRGETRPEDE